ncbi:MAG: DUF5752 family protein [Nanoarchaeota archaeon]
MPGKISAQRFFSDCHSEEVFWSNNGLLIHNIPELIDAIDRMDDFSFRYHVNKDNNKNDFADWIRDAYGEDELALRLEGVKDRAKYLRILKARVKEYS